MIREEFEKEAEEYASQSCFTELLNSSLSEVIDISDEIKEAVLYGYNKAKKEMQENGLALQSDMDKTIEQNIALKKQIEKMKCDLLELRNDSYDAGMYLRVDELIQKWETKEK